MSLLSLCLNAGIEDEDVVSSDSLLQACGTEAEKSYNIVVI